jgi:hypothetical protein
MNETGALGSSMGDVPYLRICPLSATVLCFCGEAPWEQYYIALEWMQHRVGRRRCPFVLPTGVLLRLTINPQGALNVAEVGTELMARINAGPHVRSSAVRIRLIT